MYFPVARYDRMAISMQVGFGRTMTDYTLKFSNDLFICPFSLKKTDFDTQKTEFGKIFRLAQTKMLKTFDVVGLRAQSFLCNTRTFYINNKLERFF